MNKKQKIVLWVGIALFVLVGLNPRTYIAHTTRRRTDAEISKLKQENQEYIDERRKQDPNWEQKNRLSSLFFEEPNRYVTISYQEIRWGGRRNTSTLFCYWIMIAVITGGLLVTLKEKKPKDEQKQ